MAKGPSKNEVKGKAVDDIILASTLAAATDHGGFEMRVATFQNNRGEKIPIEILPGNLCRHLSSRKFYDAILRYGRKMANEGAADHFVFSSSDARDIAAHALASGPELPEPSMFRFKSENQLSYAALPFDPVPAPTPTWDSLLERMTSPKELRAFIGSLFVPESYRQQYLWLYGEGGDGKGSIGRWVCSIFGQASVTLNTIERGDRWLNRSIAFVRAVVVADFERYGFCSTGQFKSLSGGDNIEVEEKYKDRYTVKPQFKFIFLSNQLPELSSREADRRRAIISQATGNAPGFDPQFETKLWDESGGFIAKCLADYADLCPEHGPIPFKDEEIELWTTSKEEQHQDFFERCFIRSSTPDGYITVAEMNHAMSIQYPSDQGERRSFYLWLKRQGVQKKIIKVAKKSTRVYLGIVFNPDVTSIPYRPNRIDMQTSRLRALPSEYEKNKRLSVVKIEGDQEMSSDI